MQGKHLLRLLLAALLLVAGACGGDTQDTTTPPETTAAATSPTTQAPTTTAATTTAAEPTTTAAPTTTEAPITTTTVAPTTSTTEAPAFPVTVAGVVIPERPAAIVSLSPTATEMLFAVGAGDQVIAVDEFSNYPPEAPVTELSGFRPNLEAIAAYGPDLVVMSGNPEEIASGLEALGIPVLIHEAALSLDDAYRQMRQTGAATGHSGAAEQLVASIQEEIAGLVDRYADPGLGLSYYHEISDTFFSATSSTFIGTVYSLFGLENIADAADPDGYGYPQLSAEYILEADPDIIFYGCAIWCGTSADSISERPGWDELQAVRNGYLFEVDDDISSRWGPRLIEFVRLIGQTLQTLSEAG
ncbi:MAG: ABC transporter substrate-binding protein [Acidimicrobiia bacterium]|nr:ABC transporter substrate-binding protein [Acidimicrobiia bacterium]MYF83233.1 ABC transporter substrate-binding protein [Acidimicrobiia bacterium]